MQGQPVLFFSDFNPFHEGMETAARELKIASPDSDSICPVPVKLNRYFSDTGVPGGTHYFRAPLCPDGNSLREKIQYILQYAFQSREFIFSFEWDETVDGEELIHILKTEKAKGIPLSILERPLLFHGLNTKELKEMQISEAIPRIFKEEATTFWDTNWIKIREVIRLCNCSIVVLDCVGYDILQNLDRNRKWLRGLIYLCENYNKELIINTKTFIKDRELSGRFCTRLIIEDVKDIHKNAQKINHWSHDCVVIIKAKHKLTKEAILEEAKTADIYLPYSSVLVEEDGIYFDIRAEL